MPKLSFFSLWTKGDLSTPNCDYRKPLLKIQFFDDFDRDELQFTPLKKR